MAFLCIWLVKHFGYWKIATVPAVNALAYIGHTGLELWTSWDL